MVLLALMGISGTGNFIVSSDELSSEDITVTYKDNRLESSGDKGQVALLILQEAMKRKDGATYTYNLDTFTPTIVSWGPFQFDVKDAFKASVVTYGKLNQEDMLKFINFLNEFDKLREMKAFW